MSTRPSSSKHGATTAISRSTLDAIFVRERDLVHDLIGKVTFTEMTLLQVLGRTPSPAEVKIIDAALVTLMEHGFTPSVIATRMIAMSSPEALQAAVAGGLLAVGSQFVGTMENCAILLDQIVAAPDAAAEARAVAQHHKANRLALPGFGHPIHKPDDPRSPRVLAVAEEAGVPGKHIRALRLLSAEVDRAYGRHLTINATGAIAASLREIDLPASVLRGFAVLSRCAGLIGHILEEQRAPAASTLWHEMEALVEYVGGGPAQT